jgi:coenzyme F420-reducing hydrogenase alpha subunit
METDTVIAISSALAVIVSVIALIISSLNAKQGNALASIATGFTQIATDLQKGQIEIQIREMISTARNRFEDIVLKENENQNSEKFNATLRSALEDCCNAYDEACAKYSDGKTDKDRFKKLYQREIRQWVENPVIAPKYVEPQTPFKETIKVYKEWNQ